MSVLSDLTTRCLFHSVSR
uniref:Uncharacterized protein n=1 Tax=Anguilla anguilla TaxID=7936 RepID=A0A0E9Q5Z3_ANGAN